MSWVNSICENLHKWTQRKCQIVIDMWIFSIHTKTKQKYSSKVFKDQPTLRSATITITNCTHCTKLHALNTIRHKRSRKR